MKKTTKHGRKLRLGIATPRMASTKAASMHITRFTPAEREKLIGHCRHGLEQARKGLATYDDFTSISTAAHKGLAIEAVRIVVGFKPIYLRAQDVLDAIQSRATTTGRWVPTTLYAAEITALDDLIWAYGKALEELTYAEFNRIEKLAIGRATTTGGQVFQQGGAPAEYRP